MDHTERTRTRRFLRWLVASLVMALALPAGAVQITNLAVFLDLANSPDVFDDVGGVAEERSSGVGINTSTALNFQAQYQAGVYTDAGGPGGATNIITLTANYTISFDVIDAAGSNWQLDLVTSRVGATTRVTDGNGQAAVGLSAVTGSFTGPGTITIGSLDLPAIPRVQGTTSANVGFLQSDTASIQGSGNGTVTLNFTFTATSETIVTGNQGDEAAIRLGRPANLTGFTAGNYPGPDGRDPADDGHIVDATLFDLGAVPEPGSGLLLGVGLLGLALLRRNASKPR